MLQCALVRVLAAQSTGSMSNAQVQYHEEFSPKIFFIFWFFGLVQGLFCDFWYIFWGGMVPWFFVVQGHITGDVKRGFSKIGWAFVIPYGT